MWHGRRMLRAGTAWAVVAVLALAAGSAATSCGREIDSVVSDGGDGAASSHANGREAEREAMVRTQIEAQGVKDAAVLRAMREVPRHLFVPEPLRAHAYEDRPLPIGEEQTISQPYIVALMTELARLRPGERVLEVGTGSGYQAAVLEKTGAEVYTIEIIPELARRAKETLEGLGYARIHFRTGDGYAGWPEAAPFDAVVVTAAPREVPQPLIDQLGVGGRLVIPVGDAFQTLVVITRTATGVDREEVAPVRFVPMTGEAERRPQ